MMRFEVIRRGVPVVAWLLLAAGAVVADGTEDGFVPLFPRDGVPEGWVVRQWNALETPAPSDFVWTVKDGVLHSGPKRDNWLVSEQTYENFILEFQIKLTGHGNSGVALRSPMKGDPAFDGMEFQVADVRYNPSATEAELTGAIYRAAAPLHQVYLPTEWNTCRIELDHAHLRATLNGTLIQDLDLDSLDRSTKRHDNSDAPPLKDRPRSGHIGFQHLSLNNEPVLIRNARIKVLP